jgi:hypothetical protein
MWKDPVVEEVRDAGAKLAEECGYDLHVFADMLRRNQKESNWPIVSADHLKKLKMKAAKMKTSDKENRVRP